MQHRSGWRRGASLYSLILRQTLPLQGWIIVLGLALPPLAVVPLWLLEKTIDEAIPAGDLQQVLLFGGLFLAAHLLRSGLKFAVIYMRAVIAAIVNRVLRVALIDAQRHREEPSARASLGSVTSVLTGEVQPLGDFAAEAINTPLIQGGTLVGVFGYMFATDWRLAAIGLASLALEAILTPVIQHRINLLTAERIRTLRRAGADMIDAVEPARHRLIVRGLFRIRQTYDINLRMNWLKALLKVLRNMIDHSADIGVITLGAVLVIRGEIEIGVIVAFLRGLKEIRGPWAELVNFYRRLADARVKYHLVTRAMNGDAHMIAQAMSSGHDSITVPRDRTEA